MARIETYTAQQSLQPGNTPAVQLSSAVGQEVAGLGQQVQSFAAQIQARNEQKENFKAENDKRLLDLQLAEDLRLRATEAPEDGSGVYEGFVTKDFKPKRDAFLAKLPARLRPQFEQVLADETGSDSFAWSTKAASTERDLNYDYQRREITVSNEQLATAISMDPDGYDAILAQGKVLIDASSLPTPEKLKLASDWEHMAQVSILNQMLETDAQGVLRELGYDARNLSPSTQFEVLSRAVQWQESRDNPNAISPKGAIGLMQVMPATAGDIARDIGDKNFPAGASEQVIQRYLSNPYVSKMYGEFYLKQQLKTFANTRNPIETALVAYNAGPGVAAKWVESGYDDKMLPKETRDYKAKIMGEISAPTGKGDPQSVKFVGVDTSKVNPDLIARTADAFASIGLDKVRVNSGARTAAENKAAGGAENSQHLDANALDIDTTGMSIPDRIELLKSLSAAGVTGIGVGANMIHADLGGRRAWGYATSAGGGEVPKWAAATIAEHLAGTTPPIRKVAGRYGTLPYNTRQQFTSKADQIIASQASVTAKASAVEMVQVRDARDNELALIRATGQGTPGFDETSISTILGEDDYLKFTNDRDIAQRSYSAKQGIAEMTPTDMEARIEEYAPREGAFFAADTEVQAAVKKEVDRVNKLRATRPDKAALELPQLKGTYDAMSERLAAGEDVPPADVQSFVRQMLDAQSGMEIKIEARAPVPREWAIEIGRALSRVPEPARGNIQEVNASIVAQYGAIQETFGEYADEVIAYALSEYTGISKDQADLLSGYIVAMQNGSSIFRKGALDQVQDTSQTDSFSIFDFGPGARDLFGLPGGAAPVDEAPQDGLSAEERVRKLEAEETGG